jgi:hypothetical protein
MIVAIVTGIAAVLQFALFAIWQRSDMFNTIMKIIFLFMALALAFVSLKELGFVISV